MHAGSVPAFFLCAAIAHAQVAGPIPIHAPCTQTANNVVGAYSGNLAITAWQFGFFSVDVQAGTVKQFKNGVWKPMLGGCSGRSDLLFTGDCWQSVIQLTASNGSPKWLVTPGTPTGCRIGTDFANGLMVWKWNGTAYDVVGLTAMPAGVTINRLHTTVLDGDTAWVQVNPGGGFNPRWESCDLNAMICGTTFAGSPPVGEGRQQGVGGFTYNVGIDFAHPNENGGPTHFWMARSDQPTPTRPPASTSTNTPTGGATRTPTRAPTQDQCEGFPPYKTCTPAAFRSSTPTKVPSPPSPTPVPPRFTVTVTWIKPDGTNGQGHAVAFSSTTTLYWFFTPDNLELWVKVLEGCGFNGKRWVFIAGGTNVAVTTVVKDNLTGVSKTYLNPQGTPFQPIQDTAFEPCN